MTLRGLLRQGHGAEVSPFSFRPRGRRPKTPGFGATPSAAIAKPADSAAKRGFWIGPPEPGRPRKMCIRDSLYSAGELGSIYADTYQGSGNIAECIVYGRISGANAAAQKDDACTVAGEVENRLPLVDPEPEFELGENECLGVGDGMGGELYAIVRYADGVIEDVKVAYNMETPYIAHRALEEMPARIVEANSTEVDAVAGATVTSLAIIEAVNAAIAQA